MRLTTLSAVALSAVMSLCSATAYHGSTVPSVTALDAGYSAAIHADVAASTYDPYLGKELWVAGDVTAVDGTSTVGYYGYPHQAFLTEVPGSTTFTVLPGSYGTDYWNGLPDSSHYYQQVPNWPDGTYFWVAFPIIEGSTLHVIGERIQGVTPFTVLGTYDATFNAQTLSYEDITAIPSAPSDVWSGYARCSNGYWLTSQQGNAAFVPFGGIDSPTAWSLHFGTVPQTSGSWPVARPLGGWHLFAAWYMQTPILRCSASQLTGPWSVPSTVGQMTVPENDGGILAHPDLPAPSGEILINWNENDSTSYDPQFAYVAK